jgi:hypothetical protein
LLEILLAVLHMESVFNCTGSWTTLNLQQVHVTFFSPPMTTQKGYLYIPHTPNNHGGMGPISGRALGLTTLIGIFFQLLSQHLVAHNMREGEQCSMVCSYGHSIVMSYCRKMASMWSVQTDSIPIAFNDIVSCSCTSTSTAHKSLL